jgi:thiol-disulfide isomerase/thioredoxin
MSYVFYPTEYLTEIGLTRERELWLMAVMWLWRLYSTSGTVEEFAESVFLTTKVTAGSVLFMCGGLTELLRFGLIWLVVWLLVPRPDYSDLGIVESLSPASLASKAGPCDKLLDACRGSTSLRAGASKSKAAEAARNTGLGCRVTLPVPSGAEEAPRSLVPWVGEGKPGDGDLEGLVPWVVMVGAGWSARCSQLAPMFAELSDRFAGSVRFGKVDAQRWPDAAAALRVDAETSSSSQIPTFILFRGGREALRIPPLDPDTGKAKEDAGGVLYDAPGLIEALGLGILATKAAGVRASASGVEMGPTLESSASATAKLD